jgi:DNA polymerase-3 subunit gamma/tau
VDIRMSFLSLYRKYRPGSFDDLVGQKHVVKTLKNAIINNRIAHAYLFAGPRGTGKTSTAKVFAQALNCVNGPTVSPCGECPVCRKIQSGQSIDVIEIDAASNRGIDEIRDLREKVKFYPNEGQYKVYIIDEVHMLTKGAFNALLKTLEEPPDNVVFVLATTEPHKVIETILSRCQRFDFSLLTTGEIRERLEFICQQEGVKFNAEALNIIAEASHGGLRDAISLLDQAISYTNAELNPEGIQDMLGKVDKKVLIEFTGHIINNNTSAALEMVNNLINRGNGISMFVNDLVEYFRQLLLIKECGRNNRVLDYTEEMLEQLEEESKSVETRQLIRYLEILTGVEKDLGFTDKPRLILELGIIRMASREAGDLEQRVIQLEEMLFNNSDQERIIRARNTSAKEIVSNQQKELKKGQEKSLAKDADYDNINIEKDGDSGKANTLTLDEIRKSWPSILKRVKEKNISVQAFLLEGKPDNLEEETLVIKFPENKGFHKKGAEADSGLIQKAISEVLGTNYTLKFLLEGESREKSKKKVVKTVEKKVDNDIVDEVIEAFDGEVIKVNYDVLKEE